MVSIHKVKQVAEHGQPNCLLRKAEHPKALASFIHTFCTCQIVGVPQMCCTPSFDSVHLSPSRSFVGRAKVPAPRFPENRPFALSAVVPVFRLSSARWALWCNKCKSNVGVAGGTELVLQQRTVVVSAAEIVLPKRRRLSKSTLIRAWAKGKRFASPRRVIKPLT